jgi:YVTN family beta-propeller protein
MRWVSWRLDARVRGLMIWAVLGSASVTIAAPTVYVENVTASAIIALDGGTGRIMGRIAIPGGSHGLAYDPGGQLLFVASGDTGTVSVIDAVRLKVIRAIKVGKDARSVAVSPDGKRLYIAGMAGTGSTLTVIRTDLWKVVKSVKLQQGFQSMVVGPEGDRLFTTVASMRMSGGVVGARLSGTVAIIDGRTLGVSSSGMLGGNPYGVAVSPDGLRLAVTGGDQGRVDLISTATLALIASYETGIGPESPVFRSDQELWVSNLRGDSVTVVNLLTGRTINVVTGQGPYGLGFSLDKRTAFVSTMLPGSIVRIDASTRQVTARYPVGGELHSVVVGR